MTRGRRSTSAAAAVLAGALALGGCSGSPPTASPASSSTAPTSLPISVESRALAADLRPANVEDPATARLAHLLFRGLVRDDAKGKAVDEMARSITTTDDRTYTVTLVPGRRFSDGEKVTSHSFVDAWNYAARPDSGQFRADAFAPILGYDAVRGHGGAAPTAKTLAGLSIVDDDTFTITLEQPQPGFDESLGDLAFAPLPRVALADPEHFSQHPVGNGPYRLEGTWSGARSAGGVARLRVDPAYQGPDQSDNGGIDLRVYSSPGAAYDDFVAGRLDVLTSVPAAHLADYRGTFKDAAVDQPVGVVQSLAFPVARPEWASANGLAARKAVARAIDRDALVSDVFAGTRLPSTDLAAPVVDGYSRDVCGDSCTHDDDAARSLLEQAGGMPGGRLDIAYAEDGGDGDWVDTMCRQITDALGVPCRGRPYPTALDLAEARALGRETGPYVETFDMEQPTLEAFVRPRFSAGSPRNGTGYRDDVVETQLGTAATAQRSAQPAAYAQIESTIVADLPVVPLWSVNATGAAAAGIGKARVDVFGSPVFTELTRS